LYLIFVAIYHIANKNEQKISYHQFLRISSVATEKWKIRDNGYYFLRYYDEDLDDYTEIYMSSFFDMLRLGRLYKKQKKRDFNISYMNERAKLIKMWQKDINNYHDDYLEQIGVYLKKGKKL
jgi:hypothetical protein